MNLSALIKQIANAKQVCSLLCIVNAVDEGAFTCDVLPLVEGAEFLDVRLKAKLDVQNGILLVPALHSHVIINFLTDTEAYIAQYGELDKVVIKMKGMDITANKDSVNIQNGQSKFELTKNEVKMIQGTSKVTVSSVGTKIERAGISLSTQLNSLFTQIQLITVTCPTPAGPVIVPINNAAAFLPIQQTLSQIII